MTVALSVLGIVAFAAVMFVVVPGLTFRWIARSLGPRIAAAARSGDIILEDRRANSLGLTSRGRFQSRGNGGLVLTRGDLMFFQMVPRRDLVIPLAAIREVGTVKSHLGKSYGRDLLYVAFDGPSGPDSIALVVGDLPGWLHALRSAPETRGTGSVSRGA